MPHPRPPAALLLVLAPLLALLLPGLAAAAPAAAPDAGGHWVKLREARLVELTAPLGERTAEARAREASGALRLLSEGRRPGPTTVEPRGEGRLVLVGGAPLLELGPADAAAAGASLESLAAGVATRVDAALRAERRRLEAQEVVFNVSLLVFTGLLAFLLLRRLPLLEAQLARRLHRAGGAVRIAGVEVADQAATTTLGGLALRGARLLTQLAVVGIWLLGGLSIFPQSRGLAERLLRSLLEPSLGVLGRALSAVPALLAAAVLAALAVFAARALLAVMAAAAAGQTSLRWVRADRAAALGRLGAGLLALLAVMLAVPLLGGEGGGVADRLALALLVAVALAGAPLLASAAAGLPLLLAERPRLGDPVEVGGLSGSLSSLGALSLELTGTDGATTRIPYLLLLVRPIRLAGPGGPR